MAGSQYGKSRVKIKVDKVSDVMDGISALASTRVLAGVPASKAQREEGDETPINNAELMYIHEHGAPEINLPARPVIHPALLSIKDSIVNGFEIAGKKAMDGGGPEGVVQAFNAVGIMAQNAMRKRITDGPFVPLKPGTVAARAAKAGRGLRKGEKQYAELIKNGASPLDAQTATGIKPLIDTGQLRRALTYVVRKINWKGTQLAKNIGRNSKKVG